MEAPPQSPSPWWFAVGGLLVGAVGGWMMRGDSIPADPVSGRAKGELQNTIVEAARSSVSQPAETRIAAAGGPAAGDRNVDFVAEMNEAMKQAGDWDQQRLLHATIDLLDEEGVPVAASQIHLLPREHRWTVASILGERWAEFDPPAALIFGRRLGPANGGEALIAGAFQKWSSLDPAAARAWIEALPIGSERTILSRTLIQSMARTNPLGAVEVATRWQMRGGDSYAVAGIFRQWAIDDPAAAASRAMSLPAGEARNSALNNIALQWALKDPASAIAWVAQLPDARVRNQAMIAAVAAWAGDDPAAAFAWAQSSTADAAARQDLTSRVLSAWVASDPAAAQARVLAIPPGEERETALAALIQNLGGKDLPSALGLLNQLPAGRARSEATRQIIFGTEAARDAKLAGQLFATLPIAEQNNWASSLASHLAHNDLAAALQWAHSLPEGRARRDAQNGVAQTWAQSDPRAAVEWVWKNAPQTGDDDPLNGPFAEWLQAAPEDAFAWAANLPAGEVRDKLTSTAAAHFGTSDPLRAAAIYSSLSPKAQEKTASSLVANWAQKDPAGAMAWVARLPAGAERGQILASVIARWSEQDPVAATEGLSRLPPGDEKDVVIGAFCDRAIEVDPESALAWAASIRNQVMRQTHLENLARNWLRNDPTAARQWIARTNLLTPERKTQIQRAQ